MDSKTYIHYGTDTFDRERFQTARNRDNGFGTSIKPMPGTGLWSSPLGTKYSWKNWCEDQVFNTDKLDKWIIFKVRHPEKILLINSRESLDGLFKNYGKVAMYDKPFYLANPALDFEKMIADGYVGMEIRISDYFRIYDELYGWDCDSIIIFYEDEIEIIGSSKDEYSGGRFA
jgi:hypothetical protein